MVPPQPSKLARTCLTRRSRRHAKNLAKTLDKGLAVEYVARVLIVSQFARRASQNAHLLAGQITSLIPR